MYCRAVLHRLAKNELLICRLIKYVAGNSVVFVMCSWSCTVSVHTVLVQYTLRIFALLVVVLIFSMYLPIIYEVRRKNTITKILKHRQYDNGQLRPRPRGNVKFFLLCDALLSLYFTNIQYLCTV